MPPIDKTVRPGSVSATLAEGDAPASGKRRSARLGVQPEGPQSASLSAPAPSKLKKIVKSDGFSLAAGKPMKSLKSVPVGLAVVNKAASQTMKTAAKAAGADKAAGVVTAGRVMGGVGGGMKALALVQLGVELADTRRIAKDDRASFKLFTTLMNAYDPETGKVAFEFGEWPEIPEDLPQDPTAALLELAKVPGFLDAHVKGEGLSKERTILLKKSLITTAEGTAGIATAAGAKWVPFLGTAIEGAKFVDGAVKVQGGITALNNLRGAVKDLDKTLESVPAADAEKLKSLLQGLSRHVERERLIKGGKDLAAAAVAGAAFGAGIATAVGTAGLGLAITQPALGVAAAAVDIALSVRDARHKAMLDTLRGKVGAEDAARLSAGDVEVDYAAVENIGLAERTVLHLLAAGTAEEKAAIRDYLAGLGISKNRMTAIMLHAEADPASAVKNLQEGLYKDRLSSTRSMSWGLVGNSLKNMGKMMLHVFKGWRKEPRTPPTADAESRVSLAGPAVSSRGSSIAQLIERRIVDEEPLFDFFDRLARRHADDESARMWPILDEERRTRRLSASSADLQSRLSEV